MTDDCTWQPIETAPRDGTEILSYTRSGNFYVISWDDTFSAPWRIRNDEGLFESVPMFWMPLPEAPIEHSQESAEADFQQFIFML